jgi:diguanylate cyclase
MISAPSHSAGIPDSASLAGDRWHADARDTATRGHRRATWSVLGFVTADTALLSGYAALGHVSPLAVILFALAGVGIFGLYRLFIRQGWHLHARGMTLSLVITPLVAVQLVAMAHFVPQVGLLMLMTLLPTIAMTALTLPMRYLGPMCLLLGMAAAALMSWHGAELTLPMQTGAEIALSAIWFTMLLVRGATLSVRGTELRTALARKSEALAEALQKLEAVATHDELTGLLNRRALMDLLAAEVQRGDRSGQAFSVALFDIDHFKLVNDTLGHAVGDEVLRHFATAMQATTRATDRFARYGGEEFLLLMPDQPQPPGALQVADRLRQLAEEQPWHSVAPGLKVTVSAGVATRRPGETIAQLLGRADDALYAAKRAGRNCVQAG